MDINSELLQIIENTRFQFSTIKPSEWYEQHRVMIGGTSMFQGKFKYNITPYSREIVDACSPEHPMRIGAVMKGGQTGVTTGVIEAAIGWSIAENPTNILLLTGHSDLSEEAMNKIDLMIDSCGIRHLIRPQAMRSKSMKTGDTNMKKEYAGGELIAGSAGNHKLLRQRSIGLAFIDDFEAAKQATEESGSTRKMIEQRLAAHYDKMKLFYISTPELKQSSNIEPVYLLGDQRWWQVPCPCCGEFIELKWKVDINEKETAGITWELDNNGRLIEKSVGYICQSCAGFFTDKHKYEMNNNGFWKPTATPFSDDYYSWHLSCLYAPLGMKDWTAYVKDYIEACPPNGEKNEALYKTFVNLCLAETFEPQADELNAAQLQQNTRAYEVGEVPEKLSQNDGNGNIIMLTCACDMNGKLDDARLDYEIVAWSEKGASYSITHGSIGTFVPRENQMAVKQDRERWTYEHGKEKSVWDELEKILDTPFTTDTGRTMKVLMCGVDSGYYTQYAYEYIDNPHNCLVFGLKGKDEGKYTKYGIDIPTFTPARERNKLYIVNANKVKDILASAMGIRWDKNKGEPQHDMFMNFPIPSQSKYTFTGYYEHYEAEERVLQVSAGVTVGMAWRKKTSTAQNHFFDVRVYNIVLRDILVHLIGQEMKLAKATWADCISYINGE